MALSMRVKELAAFIKAREEVRINKEAGKPKPWTKDPILQTFRFCNVRREDDAVTRWIAKNLRNRGGADLWFVMVVARLFNLPETLDEIGVQRKLINPYKSEKMRAVLKERKATGANVFNAAYIVSTNGMKMDKIDYVIDVILDSLWESRKLYRPKQGETLDAYHARLCMARGLGSFMAAQVIADLKYAAPFFNEDMNIPTTYAADWYRFAASGPGSRRGLNRVLGREPKTPWREADWREALGDLQAALLRHLPQYLGSYMHAQDIQNCLCEFDKYERIRLGEGRPKQLYPGAA